MRIKSQTYFSIRGLNQERVLNEISKTVKLNKVDRKSKTESSFLCNSLQAKQIKSQLLAQNIEILEQKNYGVLSLVFKIVTSYGMLAAFLIFACFSAAQSQFILKYKVFGTSKLSEKNVVSFVKSNFTHSKRGIRTNDVEVSLFDKFEEISLVSCMVKGQTLVINIKEKLLPDAVFCEFLPIISQKNCKITQIDLISGSALVKVGDYVRAGDVLVEPYTIDSDGKKKQVQARANIFADVYNVGTSEHFEKRIEIYRTGRTIDKSEVKILGLTVYSHGQNRFKNFEIEERERLLSKNNILPLKIKKTIFYETAQRVVESKFDDEKEIYLQKSRENALSNCDEHDKIKEEYYTIHHVGGVTIVNFCVITEEQVGVINEN